MKLLAFTDVHNSKKALKSIGKLCRKHRPDALLCLGDLTIFEMNLASIIKSIASLGYPTILIHGNHESEKATEKFCKKYKNLYFIHGKSHLIGEVLFLGYGGDGFSVIDRVFKGIAPGFEKAIAKNKEKKVILLTHAPPYGTKLDRLPGGFCGNKSIRKFIEKNQPKVSLCGHIHENFGKKDKIKKTSILNPGPFGRILKI